MWDKESDFSFSGKDILRPKQVNINVATWGRLMKRSLPQQCVDSNALTPPTQITSPGVLFFQILGMIAPYSLLYMFRERMDGSYLFLNRERERERERERRGEERERET